MGLGASAARRVPMPTRAVQVKARPKIDQPGRVVSRAYSIIIRDGNLDSAAPLILTAMLLKLVECRRRPV
jgi:hypothetical protein